MAVRNVTKAFGVFLLLCVLTSLLAFAASPSSLQARAENPPQLASAEPTKDPREKLADIPLHLRLKVDPRVLRQFDVSGSDSLQAGGPHVRYIVRLRSKADLSAATSLADTDRRREKIVAALRQTAHDSQASLVAYLQARQVLGRVTTFTSCWIVNGLVVSSDLDTLLTVAARPEVESVRMDQVRHLSPVVQAQSFASPQAEESSPSIEWNIAKIGADRVWNAYGLRGQGMVVANLDSGVDWTHPALQRKYRGYSMGDASQTRHDYNWFDATGTYPSAPADGDGHGTHTMGTMVGSLATGQNQVGVAPEARWIAVKVFDDQGNAYDSWIHAGFQWILAPTDLQGQNPDPSLAPDVCNNSWGDSNSSDTTFWDDVHALRAAGVFPVFAIGNEYQGSLAPHAPGSFPQAFSAGATDRNDVIASWSCRGPSPWNEVKPEIAAPGAGVRSTLPGNRYGTLDGTSMAAPHVAGVVALLWQAQMQGAAAMDLGATELSITATEQVITRTARALPNTGSIPNNDYGWGRLDAYQAVASVAQAGVFWGRVTDLNTGVGIGGATITMLNRRYGGTVQAWTDPQGYYTFSVAAGTYDVTATQFYYVPQTARAVEIAAGLTTQLNLRLTALPAGRVLGRVTEADTGEPVMAYLRDVGRSVQVATDARGAYTLTLPVGQHTLEAVPVLPGHRVGQATVTIQSAGQTVYQDLRLERIPKILLVDADAWLTTGGIDYYQQSLAALGYTYDTWTVDTAGSSGSARLPPASTLRTYDIVVWSHALSSPGYIGAWPVLADYLQAGKALLISGQDIGYWDVQRDYGASPYEDYLHAKYLYDDAGIQQVNGLDGTFLEGITLHLNAADSAANQEDPSEIAPSDALARRVLDYADDGAAGVAVDDCGGYRLVYLAFGLEGAGPESVRTETLRRALEWIVQPRPGYEVALATASQQTAGAPGGEAVLNVAVWNTGLQADAYTLAVEGSRWPVTIWDASRTRQVTATATLSPCSSVGLVLRVLVPEGALTGQSDTLTLHVRSQRAPAVGISTPIQVTAAMPWRELLPLPTPRYRLAAAAAVSTSDDCRFFAIGGWDSDGNALRNNEVYSLRTGAWRAMASKPMATANTAAAVIAGKVYMPGGMQGDTYLSVLEVYDPSTDRWTRGADLPRSVVGLAVAAAGGKLYVFGGNVAGGTSISDTLEYDPAAGLWSQRAPLPLGPRTYAAAAAWAGKIYVAGGWPALRTFERYDPARDSWASLAPMPTGRQSLSLVAVDGYIYAIGGGDGWRGLSTVERYDPVTDSWITLSPLASSLRAGAAAVTIAGRIFVVGGADEDRGTGAAHETLGVGTTLGDSTLTVDRPWVMAGGELHYVITLRNPGRQAIAEAAVWDEIPANTQYIVGSLVGGAVYNVAANRIEWRGSMLSESSKQFSFRVAVADGVSRGTLITNTAWVDDGQCGGQSLVAVTSVEAPDLSSSSKSVDKSVALGGEELSYVIELSNVGEVTASQVSLVDVLPQYLTYVPGSVEGGTYNAAAGRIEWSGTLAPGVAGGYRWADSDGGVVAYEWVDATVGGTVVPGGGDDVALGPFTIGFPFTFYGEEYEEFYVNTNGQVLFGGGSSAFSNAGIPDAGMPNNFIAVYWDDLVSSAGSMHYKVVGSAPGRRLVVEWAGVQAYSGSGVLTFEVVLYEGSNRVVLQYRTLSGGTASGESATVGIEDGAGAEGVEYQQDGAGPGYPLYGGLTVLFEPVGGQTIRFRAVVASDVPLNTRIVNEAQLTVDGRPAHPMTATTQIALPVLPSCQKSVDKSVALGGEGLSYVIELSNAGGVTASQVSLVDVLPQYLTYVPGSVEGGTYNAAANRIEWSGTLAPGAAGGYRWADSDGGGLAYEWVDATVGGMVVPGGGDDVALGPFPIGFPFTFYGEEYGEFYVNTNGQVLFSAGSSAFSNVGIPDAGMPNSFVAVYWDDLVSSAGSMHYKVVGSAPERRLVVEWAGVQAYSGSGVLTFEVVLYEGSNRVVLQYQTLSGGTASGESATVGIEDGAGAEGVEYQYNGTGPGYPLHSGLAVLFEPVGGQRMRFRTVVASDVPLNTRIMNEAQLTVDGRPAHPLTATTWINRIDLSPSQLAVDKSEARPGDNLLYTILLSNAGNVTATDVSLIDPIPDSTHYVPGSAGAGATYNSTENHIEWHGALSPGASLPLSFTVAASSSAPNNTWITNTSSIDDGLGNVVTKTVTTLLQTYDLSSSDKGMPTSARPGETITCTVHLRNTGVVSAQAVLTDTLPGGVALVPGSLWWSSGEGGEASDMITWHGEVIARGMVQVRFQLRLGEGLQAGARLSNTVWIQDQDGRLYERAATTTIHTGAYPNAVYLPLVLKTSPSLSD